MTGDMRLLADIGGTNARFALADAQGAIHARRQLKVSAYLTFEDALAAYLAEVPGLPSAAALSVAGPVLSNCVHMTNASWTVSDVALQSVCPDIPVQIVNDLAAVASAVPAMLPNDFEVVYPGKPCPVPSSMITINLGTGFGAAVSIPRTDRWDTLATEAGHMTLATVSDLERAVLGDGSTVEQVFSGPALQVLRDRAAARELGEADFRKLYSKVLGRLAGDLSLSVGAWGGIRLCGGVLEAFDTVVDRASFLMGLHDRRGLAKRLDNISVKRITRSDPAFLGLTLLELESDMQ